MTTTRKPYPQYKSSGVEWIGDVPHHWKVLPNRALFEERIERDQPDADMLSVTIGRGVIKQSTLLEDSSKKDSSNLDRSAYKMVYLGDLAYNKMRAWQGAVGVSSLEGIVSPAYVIQRPRRGQDPRYLHFLYRTPAFAAEAERWSYGITSDQWSLRPEHFKMIYSPLPPLEEQRAIADFLDRKDAEITRIIASRRRMIALLEEKKQAIINQAVTRGLDPTVPMKDSCVEWLGEIPAHWEHSRIRDVILDSVAGIWGEEASGNSATDIWCIRVADFDMQCLGISKAKQTYRSVPAAALLKRVLVQGDILLEKSGGGDQQPVGRVVLYSDQEPAITSNFVTRIRPDWLRIESKYLLYMLDTLQRCRVINPAIKQTTGIQNLDERAYLSYRIPVPPIEEQQAIIEHVDRVDQMITQHRSRLVREIELIQEYRTRLISDVVTGKVRVS